MNAGIQMIKCGVNLGGEADSEKDGLR